MPGNNIAAGLQPTLETHTEADFGWDKRPWVPDGRFCTTLVGACGRENLQTRLSFEIFGGGIKARELTVDELWGGGAPQEIFVKSVYL